MTYIYKTCTDHDAVERAHAMGRLTTDEERSNFTAEAVRTLFDYYEQLAEDMGEPIPLDIIAWCREWAEYDHIEEAASEYDHDDAMKQLLSDWLRSDDADEADDVADQMLDWFRDHTTVLDIGDTGRVLIEAF